MRKQIQLTLPRDWLAMFIRASQYLVLIHPMIRLVHMLESTNGCMLLTTQHHQSRGYTIYMKRKNQPVSPIARIYTRQPVAERTTPPLLKNQLIAVPKYPENGVVSGSSNRTDPP